MKNPLRRVGWVVFLVAPDAKPTPTLRDGARKSKRPKIGVDSAHEALFHHEWTALSTAYNGTHDRNLPVAPAGSGGEEGIAAGNATTLHRAVDLVRGAGRFLAGQPEDRLHGQELRRRLRDRSGHAAHPLPDLLDSRGGVLAGAVPGKRRLPDRRTGEVQGPSDQPHAGVGAVDSSPGWLAAAGAPRPTAERGRHGLEEGVAPRLVQYRGAVSRRDPQRPVAPVRRRSRLLGGGAAARQQADVAREPGSFVPDGGPGLLRQRHPAHLHLLPAR